MKRKKFWSIVDTRQLSGWFREKALDIRFITPHIALEFIRVMIVRGSDLYSLRSNGTHYNPPHKAMRREVQMNSVKTKSLLILWIIFVHSCNVSYAKHYGNKFIIAPNNNLNVFTVDRIGQKIYADYYGGTVFKMDLKTMAVESTNFISTPTFSNRQHLMVTTFRLNDSNYDTGAFLAITDIDKGSSYTIPTPDSLGNSGAAVPFAFSPNDSNFMFSRYHTNSKYSNYYFSLKDSSLTPMDSSVNFNINLPPQWSSDTSFVYGTSDSSLVEYFIRSKRVDTLVTLHNYNHIVSFAYNTQGNILAYSTYRGGDYPLIYFHYKDFLSDSLVFSPTRDDPDSSCWKTFLVDIESLCWSPNIGRLGFIGNSAINGMAPIYFYLLDSNRTYAATQCIDWDYKYFLTWAR